MTTTRALPTTIDGVIERPALHDRVTLAVREGIRRGEVRDGPRCREVRRIGRRRAPV